MYCTNSSSTSRPRESPFLQQHIVSRESSEHHSHRISFLSRARQEGP
ncbi:hypothetical protein B566_EDAN005382 [Ephemera danica]|nr:hypothetical protein B566_EDAN005382 [Ephemera danica]